MSDLHMHIGRPAAWIEVTGEDSFTFLQGQSTNDLRSPAPAPATYALWLDRKGKVIADSFILQEAEDRLFLFSYASAASTIIERLEPFIIADDVALRDLTAETVSIAIWGKGIDDVLIHCGFERPDHGSFFHRDRNFIIRGRRSRNPNVDLVVTGDDNDETVAAISSALVDAGGLLVDKAAVDRERIESSIPSVPRDLGPKDLPQEGNLEHAAISYKKGCYLGQEVMARIRSMGQVRRTLVQVRIKETDAPETPAPLYLGDREVGSLRTLTDISPFAGLALVRKEAAEKSIQLSLSPDGRATVEITDVPTS